MFNVEYVKDLKWVTPDNSAFKCVVKYAEFDEEHPSAITPLDGYAHIQKIWQDGISGVYGPIAEYEPDLEGVIYVQHEQVPVTELGNEQL